MNVNTRKGKKKHETPKSDESSTDTEKIKYVTPEDLLKLTKMVENTVDGLLSLTNQVKDLSSTIPDITSTLRAQITDLQKNVNETKQELKVINVKQADFDRRLRMVEQHISAPPSSIPTSISSTIHSSTSTSTAKPNYTRNKSENQKSIKHHNTWFA